MADDDLNVVNALLAVTAQSHVMAEMVAFLLARELERSDRPSMMLRTLSDTLAAKFDVAEAASSSRHLVSEPLRFELDKLIGMTNRLLRE